MPVDERSPEQKAVDRELLIAVGEAEKLLAGVKP